MKLFELRYVIIDGLYVISTSNHIGSPTSLGVPIGDRR